MMRTILFFTLYVIKNMCKCDGIPLVTIDQGVVRGVEEISFLKELNYYSFKGIPYAKPPVGPLRFQPPEPHDGWSEIYEANKNKPTCFQYNSKMRNGESFGMSGSEDCLYISVFTPKLDGTFPVIVFDFNDNFRTGFNGTKTYSPDFFMEEDVIVVTIQHRLDIFGYFTTEDEVIPPNAGIKDFILGLNWVQQNINKFGGDPGRVTLMGSLGGAVLANILLYSEKASGLFSGVILQSGTALEPSFFDTNTREVAFKLGKILDVDTSDSKTLLEEMQKLDTESIVKKESDVVDLKALDMYQKSTFPFGPIVEGNNSNAVVKSLPEDGEIINDVPIMIGMNSREGLDLASHYIFEPKMITEFAQDFLFLFPIRTNFRFDRKSPIFEKAIKDILNFYFEEGYFYYNNILEYAVYCGDILQNYALNYAAKQLSVNVKSPVFFYVFDFRGLLNENSEYMARHARFSMQHWGATIGDELCYLHFCTRIKKQYQQMKKLVSEQPEIKVLRKMVRLWSNFAKTGNPTPDNDDVLKGFKWQPIDKDSNNTNYLRISRTLQMKTDPLSDRDDFWDDFLTRYSKLTIDGVVQDEVKYDVKEEIEIGQSHEEL